MPALAIRRVTAPDATPRARRITIVALAAFGNTRPQLSDRPVGLVSARLIHSVQVGDVLLKQRHGEGDQQRIGIRLSEGQHDEASAAVVDHQPGLERVGAAGGEHDLGHGGLSLSSARSLAGPSAVEKALLAFTALYFTWQFGRAFGAGVL